MAYGKGYSRFDENKRAVTEKHMGPLIKTVMTRCIHCTRCVRFSEEVAGVEEIGALYRGENMQITSYLEQAVSSELSANVIDLCPVGALTSKPTAFHYRPWELKRNDSIDVMDAVGGSTTIHSRTAEVIRITPGSGWRRVEAGELGTGLCGGAGGAERRGREGHRGRRRRPLRSRGPGGGEGPADGAGCHAAGVPDGRGGL
jgi:uncharacterized Fe-S cluster protein YjdI